MLFYTLTNGVSTSFPIAYYRVFFSHPWIFLNIIEHSCLSANGLVVGTRNLHVAGANLAQAICKSASNLEQAANLLCAQANSASYPQRDGK